MNQESNQENKTGDFCYSNQEAEKMLLGSCLIDNEIIGSMSDYLRSEHFTSPIHEKIYSSMLIFYQKGIAADPITLKNYLIRDDKFKDQGDYLIELVESALLTKSAKEYGKVIYDSYIRRQLINAAHNIIKDATQSDTDAISQIENGERMLYEIATEGMGSERNLMPFSHALSKSVEVAELAFKRKSQVVGITTGFTDLDSWLGGLHPSDLLIVAGRPSMGKTAFATNIAFNAAKTKLNEKNEGGNVLFFSLEMSAEQLSTRILSTETGISSDSLRKGMIKSNDFEKFIGVASNLEELPMFIDDTPALTVASIRNRSRRLKRKSGLDLIVIDYLQLIDGGKRKENRVQEISDITRELKGLAKELNVPVIALSQLSRAVEQREVKKPQLSDLRESGSIEQDADVVMFIYREEYYLERQEPDPSSLKHSEWVKKMESIHKRAEVIIAKQRHGPVGTIKLFFDGNLTRFGNLDDFRKEFD